MSPEMNFEVALESGAADYARLHGLAVDYLAEPLPFSQIELVQNNISNSLTDDTDLFSLESTVPINIEEHLTVDKDAARLLQSAYNGISSLEEIDSIISPLLDVRKIKKLRMETPLLLTDPETDFKDFGRWEESDYMDGCLPMEPLDEEMDVGLGWPKRLQKLPAEVLEELQAEKIELSKHVLLYLRVEIKGRWTEEDERGAWENAAPYKRNTALEPITPPLLPTSPPFTPYIHSSPDGHLPLLSDPASLISEDAQKAQEAVFDDDKLLAPAEYISPIFNSSTTLGDDNCVNPSDINLPLTYIEDLEEDLFPPRVRTEDCKVEVPLISPLPMATLPKTVTFSKLVEEMQLDPISNDDEGKLSTADSEVAMDRFFQEAFGEAANRASRALEQEQLQEADANGRVDVPIMDFSLPNPPWEQLEKLSQSTRLLAAQKSFVVEVQEELGRPPHWPGINKVVPKLRWTVFASELAKVVLDEDFGDDDILATFLHPWGESVVDSGGLTWKPPGLRILNNDERNDEEDLDIGSFDVEQPQDVLALVKKCKMRFLEEGLSLTGAKPLHKGTTIAHMNTNLMITESQRDGNVTPDNTIPRATLHTHKDFGPASKMLESGYRREMILDGPFSAADALDNFLEMRAAKRQKPTSSPYFARKPVGEGTNATLPSNPSKQAKLAEPSRAIKRHFPVPNVTIPSTPMPYIISSTILKRRNLIRFLNGLIPNAIPIERDFTAHNMTIWNRNFVTRSPVASPLDSEADIIISPSSGIILTTLQKIKQKPLPGQKSKPAFKQRLEKVSLRYEKLIVLVSEGCADESTNGLAEFDALALAELTGFCGSLEINAIVQFVAGGEETLTKWVAAILAHYSLQGEAAILLLQDETLWELFLRRAGMNAFAAQALIAHVKAPEGVEVNSPTKAGMFGITALVEMGPQERMRRFEALVGGSRVLTRVGRLLDGNWS